LKRPCGARRPRSQRRVVGVEAVELAQRAAQAGAVADEDDECERGDPGDRRPEVHCLDEWPAGDELRQGRQVEHEPRAEQDEKR